MTKNAMFNLRDYTTADILNTPVRRGGILPVTEYPNRTEFDLSSGLTGALMNSVTAPARAARGEISEAEMIPEAFNFAGSLTLGSLLAPRPTGSVGMGGRAAKGALDMSEAARMARAKEMGFDTPFYHVTQNQFDEFKPGVRGASFFAGTEADAARGAGAGQREWTMNTATEPNRAPRRTISALGKSSTIEGLALSPSQKKLFEAMPDKMSLDDYQNVWRKRIEDEFGTVPPWLYDDGTVSMPDGRVFSYDDLSKLTDAELDEVRTFGKETLSKGQIPAFSYEDARRTGRDIFGRQIAHWGPTSDEAAIAKRVSDKGMGGYLINDEAGVSVAVTDPRNIRSVNAAFDPEKAHLANLLAANAKTGAAVPLATKALEAQQPQGIRAFHGSPHDFDRFSMEHIGKGEGAQAYGHGLYFAENEGVAKAYREALSDKTDALTPVTFEGRKIGPSAPGISGEDLAASFAAQSGGNAKLARAHIRGIYNDPNNLPPAHKEAMRLLTEQPERFASAKYLEPGHMYEVNIKADPNDFLDWDKPLSQQSEKVRNAVLGSGLAKTPFGSIDTVKHLLAKERGRLAEAQQEIASNRGIFGRSKTSKDERSYYERIADEARARIDEFERILSGDATASYLIPQHGDTAAQFSHSMRDAGIPGIRYLDQMSRGTGEGSSNYVVFDDALVEILRKYGLLPPVAAGGLAAALGQEDELY